MKKNGAAQAALSLGALGVVFGDIGTSPLYTIQTVFNPGDPQPVKATTGHIFGIVSLIFWSVTIIVTVTYVLLVMRADNDGDGGIMALIALIRRRGTPPRRRWGRSTCHGSTGRSWSPSSPLWSASRAPTHFRMPSAWPSPERSRSRLLLFFYVVRQYWGRPTWLVFAGAGALLTVDLLFVAANLTKLTHGAWLPLLIALATYTVFTTWQRGRELVTKRRRALEGVAPYLHRGAPCQAASAAARAWDGDLPQPRQGDCTARDASERRAQPHPPPARW